MRKGFIPKPPAGYTLEKAVLTTFDFDMDTFLSLIKGEDISKFLVFRGDGLYQNDCNADESFLIKAFYPLITDRLPEKYAHSKICLFRYVNEKGKHLYRLRIGSKNIHSFDNAEIEIDFDGKEAKRKQAKNQPLLDLLTRLSSFVEDQDKYESLKELIEDLGKVSFSLKAPYECESYSFLTSGFESSPLFKEPYDELLIISPNISPNPLNQVLSLQKEGGRSLVIATPLTVAKLIEENAQTPCYLFFPIEKYIHAKLFLIRKEGRFDIFVGSMNLTNYAVAKNDEAMVYLKGVKGIESLPDFLSHFLNLPIEVINNEISQYEKPEPSSFIETAAFIKTRISYLSHILQRDKYEDEEQKKAVASLLSQKMEERLESILTSEELDLLPVKKEIRKKGKLRETYSLPFFDNLALGCVNHALHSYDELFSKNVYLHVKGRGPRDIFKRIRQDKSFSSLYLFRTDIHNFDPSMDEEVLLKKVDDLFAFDPSIASFLKRYVSLKKYRLEEDGPIQEDGPAQYTGLPLGGFLENLYLYDFDNAIEKEAVFYARCGDDILLGTTSQEETAKVASLVESLLTEGKLTLSQSKTCFVSPGEAVSFLGWKIENGEIDFEERYLQELEKNIRIYADKVLRLSKKRAIRLFSVIKLVDSYIERNDFHSSFKVISTDAGLKRIDRMIYEFIRVLASGQRGKAKYKISHKDLQLCGYQTLVNAYYRYLKR